MASNRLKPFIKHLRRVLHPADDGRFTDGQLLGLYLSARDESALEALVRRHGKMVLSVCRRLLGNSHDAEDSFQATFLVLTRKAETISPREAVGNWLYGVAYRTALEARTMNGRRRAHERQVENMPHPAVGPAESNGELREALDRELNRLPDKYRLPVVLCELEGRPRREVARQLGLAEGTLSSRLATARKLLAKKLAKYGSGCTGAALAALFPEAAAGIPPALVISTVRVVAGGTTAQVAALAQGVLKTMLIAKLKAVSWVTALAVSLSAGAVGLSVVFAQDPAGPIFVQGTGAAPAQTRLGAAAAEGAALATRVARDDLDELRLEIEALRKGLQATRERVRTLETELNAIKGRTTSANTKGQTSATITPDGHLVTSTPLFGGVGTPKKATIATPALAGTGIGPGLGGRPSKFAAGVPATGAQNVYILEAYLVDPLRDVESALKKVRENPADKEALEALTQAIQQLKSKTKPATTPGAK